MSITRQNEQHHELQKIALSAVHKYNTDTSFDPEKHYTITVPKGELTRLHGGGRADVYLLDVQGKRYCLKHFHDSRLISWIRNGLNLGKASQSYKISTKLQQLDINAPRVLTVAQTTFFGSPLLIMEMLEGCSQLNVLMLNWKKEGGNLSAEPLFQQLAHRFGLFCRTLLRQQVLHRDFSPRNILVREVNALFEFYLIDLEDVHFGKTSQNNLDHFHERLPRYLNPSECTMFQDQFHKAYSAKP